MPIKEKTVLMDGVSVDRALVRISHQILERNTDDAEDICLIGIKTRGEFLAERIADNIETIIGVRPSVSSLDITGFRDDVEGSDISADLLPDIPFSVEGKTVILCDDVIYTGRSARAAMEAVIRTGRPARIQFFALIDRGHRELPIRPDYIGKNVPTSRSEIISVCLPETDGEYCVKLGERE